MPCPGALAEEEEMLPAQLSASLHPTNPAVPTCLPARPLTADSFGVLLWEICTGEGLHRSGLSLHCRTPAPVRLHPDCYLARAAVLKLLCPACHNPTPPHPASPRPPKLQAAGPRRSTGQSSRCRRTARQRWRRCTSAARRPPPRSGPPHRRLWMSWRGWWAELADPPGTWQGAQMCGGPSSK